MGTFGKIIKLSTLFLFSATCAFASAESDEVFSRLEKQNITWTQAGKTSADSMPAGNGDIGLNAWATGKGEVYFYISKTDSWSEDLKGSNGLLKIAKVKITLNPELKGKAQFSQTLRLKEGEIIIKYASGRESRTFRIYADANNPQIVVDISSDRAAAAKVELENLRPNAQGIISADNAMEVSEDKIALCHFNKIPQNEHLHNLAFGAVAGGENFKAESQNVLVSKKPSKNQSFTISGLSGKFENPQAWHDEALKLSQKLSAIKSDKRIAKHREWWSNFWLRSYIFAEGDRQAENITKGYTLQRYKTACAGRGKAPIKFNGSIFTTDRENYRDKPRDADYRTWGGQYWFQNTRPMYWARLMAGDFDMMKPLFEMYFNQLPLNEKLTKEFYGHGGAYFAETAPFYGGFDKVAAPDSPEHWTAHYYLPIIELSMMALDYYEYTQDEDFAKERIVPMLAKGVQFYLEHFPRDKDGKIFMSPCNSLEQYWKVQNPLPDIVGLGVVLKRALALSPKILPSNERKLFENTLKILPPIPSAIRNGKKVLLPYSGEQTAKPRNMENPELYSIYPFRLYGLGKPNYELALDSFKWRKFKHAGCWFQDGVQAAMLGLAEDAKFYADFCFNPNAKEPDLKFYAFWRNANDYSPDEDNGGNGEHILQRMIMYPEGKKLMMAPAIPENWSGIFKLAAPYKTTVSGSFKNGKITQVKTFPEKRKADIIDAIKIKSELKKSAPIAKNLTDAKFEAIKSENQKALARTVKTGANEFALDSEIRQSEIGAFDQNPATKHMNAGQDKNGFNPKGVNTGIIARFASPQRINAIRFITAEDRPERDPMKITVEASNSPHSEEAGFKSWTLLYEGESGVLEDAPRNSEGLAATFKNSKPYKYYRILITQVKSGSADGVQYAEMILGETK